MRGLAIRRLQGISAEGDRPPVISRGVPGSFFGDVAGHDFWPWRREPRSANNGSVSFDGIRNALRELGRRLSMNWIATGRS
jgi:hypothetical protein